MDIVVEDNNRLPKLLLH